ncbi:hypothetical protein [Paenibacillus donghaensis]|uniref:Uncharacterized protein n=1 Tax=Paenibacillus donghaensis TaxID=414771 RepID=A0A2Z2KTR6_9BACL|nr:hypothetical protein [Paenibacillus donghaensis]ASA25302.1 hypothetical protein B9T62_33965 [Paenibacillus donghaensis]
MKKEIGVLMLVGSVLLSGCGPDKSAPVSQGSMSQPSSVQINAQNDNAESNMNLVVASEDQKVKLYANKEEGKGFNGVTLDVNGVTKEFDWTFTSTGSKPVALYTDLTGDGAEEAVVIMQTANGTQLDNYDIHVLNPKDLSEIKVQDFKDIVSQNIKSQVSKNDDGTLSITVETQGEKKKLKYNFDPSPDYNQSELGFGAIIIYYVEEQTIKLNFTGSVGTSPITACEFTATYTFNRDKNEFVVDQIDVKPVEE